MRVMISIRCLGTSEPDARTRQARRNIMKPGSPCVVAMAFGVLALGAGPSGAQTAPPSATAAKNAARVPATLSRPTGRFGRTLGLPKDGKDLYIPDEDYIRFPLPPGEQAYADVDPMKIK